MVVFRSALSFFVMSPHDIPNEHQDEPKVAQIADALSSVSGAMFIACRDPKIPKLL